MKYLKLLIFIIFIPTLISCITERKCAEKYPVPIITKDSTVYITKLVPVTIHDTVRIKGDTVYGEIHTVPNIENLIRKNTEYCAATTKYFNGMLSLNLIQRDSLINNKIESNVKVVEKTRVITNTVIKKIWVTHWYYTGAMYFTGATLLLLIVGIIIRVVKGSFISIIK